MNVTSADVAGVGVSGSDVTAAADTAAGTTETSSGSDNAGRDAVANGGSSDADSDHASQQLQADGDNLHQQDQQQQDEEKKNTARALDSTVNFAASAIPFDAPVAFAPPTQTTAATAGEGTVQQQTNPTTTYPGDTSTSKQTIEGKEEEGEPPFDASRGAVGNDSSTFADAAHEGQQLRPDGDNLDEHDPQQDQQEEEGTTHALHSTVNFAAAYPIDAPPPGTAPTTQPGATTAGEDTIQPLTNPTMAYPGDTSTSNHTSKANDDEEEVGPPFPADFVVPGTAKAAPVATATTAPTITTATTAASDTKVSISFAEKTNISTKTTTSNDATICKPDDIIVVMFKQRIAMTKMVLSYRGPVKKVCFATIIEAPSTDAQLQRPQKRQKCRIRYDPGYNMTYDSVNGNSNTKHYRNYQGCGNGRMATNTVFEDEIEIVQKARVFYLNNQEFDRDPPEFCVTTTSASTEAAAASTTGSVATARMTQTSAAASATASVATARTTQSSTAAIATESVTTATTTQISIDASATASVATARTTQSSTAATTSQSNQHLGTSNPPPPSNISTDVTIDMNVAPAGPPALEATPVPSTAPPVQLQNQRPRQRQQKMAAAATEVQTKEEHVAQIQNRQNRHFRNANPDSLDVQRQHQLQQHRRQRKSNHDATSQKLAKVDKPSSDRESRSDLAAATCGEANPSPAIAARVNSGNTKMKRTNTTTTTTTTTTKSVEKLPAAKAKKTYVKLKDDKSSNRRTPVPEWEGRPPPDEYPGEGNDWPEGWTKKLYKRQSGATKGHLDAYWFTPLKQYKLRSISEIRRFLDALARSNGDEDAAWRARK